MRDGLGLNTLVCKSFRNRKFPLNAHWKPLQHFYKIDLFLFLLFCPAINTLWTEPSILFFPPRSYLNVHKPPSKNSAWIFISSWTKISHNYGIPSLFNKTRYWSHKIGAVASSWPSGLKHGKWLAIGALRHEIGTVGLQLCKLLQIVVVCCE